MLYCLFFVKKYDTEKKPENHGNERLSDKRIIMT